MSQARKRLLLLCAHRSVREMMTCSMPLLRMSWGLSLRCCNGGSKPKWNGLRVVWRLSFVNLCCQGCVNFLRGTNQEHNLSLFPSPLTIDAAPSWVLPFVP